MKPAALDLELLEERVQLSLHEKILVERRLGFLESSPAGTLPQVNLPTFEIQVFETQPAYFAGTQSKAPKQASKTSCKALPQPRESRR
jgi:hypothetical protein